MRNVVFVDGVRTGFGKLGGTLKDFTMSQLATIAIDGLLDKTQILERGGKIDGVYMGGAFQDALTQGLARYAVLGSKLGYDVWSTTIERQCGSAIESINHAAGAIALGMADIMIAGGSESFSQLTCKMSMSTEPYKMKQPRIFTQLLSPNPEDGIDMIATAENVAKMYGITRQDCDEFAYRSQHRAAAAWEKGYFDDEVIPVVIPATKKTSEIIFRNDEFMRPSTSMEGLAALKSVKENGVVTAGNASGRNDGGAMVLMMTEEKAKELGYEPFARFVSAGNSALDPKIMGLGPINSSLDALKHADLKITDIDLFECNEAFAAQNIGVIKGLEQETGITINQDNWNPNGGAISYGHPNGASGARICMFTMRELARRGARYGLFTSCCGGGLGVTTIIENLRK